MNPVETFLQFAAAVNGHEPKTLRQLMSDDHLFVDSLGNQMQTAAAMEAGWTGYFKMCPDYSIRVDQVAVEGDVVLAVGEAGGTIRGVAWKTPAAWKAVVRDGKVSEWRVFADNKPVYEILSANPPGRVYDQT